jgi:hypothetical protein
MQTEVIQRETEGVEIDDAKRFLEEYKELVVKYKLEIGVV